MCSYYTCHWISINCHRTLHEDLSWPLDNAFSDASSTVSCTCDLFSSICPYVARNCTNIYSKVYIPQHNDVPLFWIQDLLTVCILLPEWSSKPGCVCYMAVSVSWGDIRRSMARDHVCNDKWSRQKFEVSCIVVLLELNWLLHVQIPPKIHIVTSDIKIPLSYKTHFLFWWAVITYCCLCLYHFRIWSCHWRSPGLSYTPGNGPNAPVRVGFNHRPSDDINESDPVQETFRKLL